MGGRLGARACSRVWSRERLQRERLRQGIADDDWPKIQQVVLEVETFELVRRIEALLKCARRVGCRVC